MGGACGAPRLLNINLILFYLAAYNNTLNITHILLYKRLLLMVILVVNLDGSFTIILGV